MARILKADVAFFNGLMLEGRMADTFFKAARKGKSVYAVTELRIRRNDLIHVMSITSLDRFTRPILANPRDLIVAKQGS